MAAFPRYTYDGLPVAAEPPHGAAVIVRRPAAAVPGGCEYLILHRAHHGPGYEGDWAWTPPSGSRQPGEAVLAAALRELSEETGLVAAPADLAAIDLGGRWVRFRLDVPPGARAQVDPEHDRFEWLTADAAIARCTPATVADGVRRAHSAMTARLAFRPLALADLPALVSWQNAPHAVRWFPERLDLAGAEARYGPRIACESPVRVHVAEADGRACGFLQHYRVADLPGYAAATGRPDAIGLDYAIGLPELTGRGLGPQLIWSYLRDVVMPAHPAAKEAVASPDAANASSVRALEKAGLVPAGQIAGESGPEALCALDLVRFLGSSR